MVGIPAGGKMDEPVSVCVNGYALRWLRTAQILYAIGKIAASGRGTTRIATRAIPQHTLALHRRSDRIATLPLAGGRIIWRREQLAADDIDCRALSSRQERGESYV
ncbi:hypothetical protein A6A03_05390 [Chloroflexus islandicus]|uniref:Uncharacterized protein n=1 Tax=Chloroflexus islandicus TaxID=1707952 RepID=A0A178LUF2_9CHLR|nr:hypothetical protein A6A03_05390 [Chloroflexus islandicus]